MGYPFRTLRYAMRREPTLNHSGGTRATRVKGEKGRVILYCQACMFMTTKLEAALRAFDAGRCGVCNGKLEPLPPVRVKTSEAR